jgi:hypothetical protein
MKYYYYIVSAEQRRDFKEEDYKIFLAKLAESVYLNNVTLYAFTFLPPRFHLLLEAPEMKVDRFMQHLNVSFAMALKLTRHHKGPLFSGKYLAYPFTNKNLLLPFSQYIHLLHQAENPNLGWKYSWSSLPGYLSEAEKESFINYDRLLTETGGRDGYRRRLREMAKTVNPKEGIENLLAKIERFLPKAAKRGEKKRLKPKRILAVVAEAFGVKQEEILNPNRKGKIRGVAAEFLLKFCGLTQNEIGRILGNIGYSAVSHLRYRMREKMKNDKRLAKTFEEIERKLTALSK